MKKLALILLTFAFMIGARAQNSDVVTYKCLHYFEADSNVEIGAPVWKETVEIKKNEEIKVTDKRVTIKAKKNWFEYTEYLGETNYEDHTRLVWYCKDKHGTEVFVIFLIFPNFMHIYVQYADLIYGYNIAEVE